ncbi:MAG: RDD family protein [Desulfuromonadales bacterium]|nr:RDD family protein [Desulfuromonadales bacterium]
MRCPKCGFNSFDHLQSCKKCGKDLAEHKSRFGLHGVLLASLFTEPAEVIETVAPDAAGVSQEEEDVQLDSVVEKPSAQPGDDALGFEFTVDSDEEDELAFDELFEDESQEEDPEEALPSPQSPRAADLLDEPAPFDLEETLEDDSFVTTGNDLSLDTPDFGLDEARGPKETEAETTELGLDDSDFAALEEDAFAGGKEDPDHPFGSKEDLLNEDSSTIGFIEVADTPDRDEPIDFLTDLPPEPIATEGTTEKEGAAQEDLFSPLNELPPLPETKLAEPSLESLETTYGAKPLDDFSAGTSDDFTLGVLPPTVPAIEPEAARRDKPPRKSDASSPVATESPSTDEDEGLEQPTPPPFIRRISAFAGDVVLIGLVGLCFVIVAETALSESPPGNLPTLETLIDLSIPYFLVMFCLSFGYFTLFHFLTGQTPGKMLTEMRVETTAGEAIAFSQAFMRSVGGLIQLLPAGLGYLTVLRKDGRGWNDRLAGTRLVDLKARQEEETEAVTAFEPPSGEI